ncbi:MAG: FkbM family methyltransferase [Pseudomonadota bacterium]
MADGQGVTETFQIGSIVLEIPRACLGPGVRRALRSGRYERAEARAMNTHIRGDDRVLDLGAGAGFICTLAAERVGAENVLGLEANPDMAAAAQANLARNGYAAGRVLHGAIVGSGETAREVAFQKGQGFWSGHVVSGAAAGDGACRVPAFRLGAFLTKHQPTLVIIDLEGGEAALIGEAWPDCTRSVILELHAGRYGGATIREIFRWFFAEGFSYAPEGSRGQLVVFQRT